MSTTTTTLSAGLKALANSGLLPADLTPQELQNATPAQLMKIAVGNAESSALSSMFGGTTAAGDSVNLSESLTATLLRKSTGTSIGGASDANLHALRSALEGTTSTSSTATSAQAAATGLTNATKTEVGSLFSYLG